MKKTLLAVGIILASVFGCPAFAEEDIMHGEVESISIPDFTITGEIKGEATVRNDGNYPLTVVQELNIFTASGSFLWSNVENSEISEKSSGKVEQVWNEAPGGGQYKVEYRVYVLGEMSEVAKTVLFVPIWAVFIILLGVVSLGCLIYIGTKQLAKKLKMRYN